MRIIRPGSVVGPQQQYMYLKQLEWCKWAAIDDLRKTQAAAAAAAMTAVPLVTPATPPAETDEETDAMQLSTMTSVISSTIPPVTPSKHVATAAAKAKAIIPPGQPRKTPQAKRVAVDSDIEEEEDDVLPALGMGPSRRPSVKSKVSGKITASESRPTRVTRSTAGAAVIKKAGATATASPSKNHGQGPNKIPRLATTRTTAASRAALAAGAKSRSVAAPTSAAPPTPSRLPTLAPLKRPHHATANSLTDVVASMKRPQPVASDAWMTTNAAAVVVPETKSGRPGLRSIRRRRSSFSSADVVA
jgi:cell division cycle 14